MPNRKQLITGAVITLVMAVLLWYVYKMGRERADFEARMAGYRAAIESLEVQRDSLRSVSNQRADSLEAVTDTIALRTETIRELNDRIRTIRETPDYVPFDGTAAALADSVDAAFRRRLSAR